MANKKHGTLYIGVTSNLYKRIFEHKNHLKANFTTKYGCNKLVYFEKYSLITDAIAREKQLKAGNRKTKISLIEQENPQRSDITENWFTDMR